MQCDWSGTTALTGAAQSSVALDVSRAVQRYDGVPCDRGGVVVSSENTHYQIVQGTGELLFSGRTERFQSRPRAQHNDPNGDR